MITTTVDALRGAINDVLPAVPSQPVIKALSAVLIDADAQTITATNLDLGITTTCHMRGSGRMLVPAKLLAQILGTLPGGDVALQELDNGRVKISAGRNVSHVATMPVEDYPDMPETDVELGTLDGAQLATLARSVAYAAATEDSRPILKAINVAAAGGTVTATSSDGFRLARATLGQADGEYSALILGTTLAAVSKLRLSDDDTARLCTNQLQRHYAFVGRGWRVVGRTVDGRYPDIARIIPRESATTITIEDTAALGRALQLATLFDANYLVHVVVGPDRVTFRAAGSETGDGEAVVPAQVSGPALTTAANARLLRDAVNALRGPVTLRLQSAVSPISIVGAADAETPLIDAAQLHIVMPMSVR